MTEKEKLEARIEQNQADQKALVAECDLIKAELAALSPLAKPELRHLDYGLDKSGQPCINCETSIAWPDSSRPLTVFGDNLGWNFADHYEQEVKTIFGNLADDLEELAKPLSEFEIKNTCRKISAEGYGKQISMYIIDTGDKSNKVFTFDNLAQTKDFSMKLRQVIRTAEQK